MLIVFKKKHFQEVLGTTLKGFKTQWRTSLIFSRSFPVILNGRRLFKRWKRTRKPSTAMTLSPEFFV